MISGNNQPSGSRSALLGICIFLSAITWLVFGQTLTHDFINYDDQVYVYENEQVSNGLTLNGIVWAFTHSVSGNWHPLTIATHMIDCQLYGLDAGGHHCTNVVLHTLAVLLLFFVLREMTSAIWPSAFVAALFAIHPLRVESVAWVSERKDVLSAVFFMLTLAAYVRYTRRSSIASYLLMTFFFALGLMSKPMLVTLPFVLLLLDYWPLARFATPINLANDAESSSWLDRRPVAEKLIFEKIPLVVLAAVSCVIALLLQGKALNPIAHIPLLLRVYNAVVSCVTYIWQMLWPDKLALLYPYPLSQLSIWPCVFAIGLLLAVTLVVWEFRKERPYLITGWLWYLGMLVPVIGLIQVGAQARADRYTYLPQIGLYLAATWAIADLSRSWPHRRKVLSILATAVIGLLAWRASSQTSYWKNSETIWNRTLAVTSNNAIAHQQLGNAALAAADLETAIFHFEESLKIAPDQANVHTNLGVALARDWRFGEAITHFEKSLAIAPETTATLHNFAWLLASCPEKRFRNASRAIELADKADRLSGRKNPFYAHTLAAAYAETGRFSEAITVAERGLQLAISRGDSALASELSSDIDRYRTSLRQFE